jgi:tryptophan synthase alpha chain
MKDKVFRSGKSVIPFLTLGYPDLGASEQLIYVLDEAGVDLIMLGIPFSDPAGESPILRRAGEVALKNGLTTDRIFDLLRRVRRQCDIPLALKSYANIVFAYGTERFVQKGAEHKINALILPDVPFEEQAEFKGVCARYGIHLISNVAQAPEERIAQITRQAQGFIYLSGSVTEVLVSTVRQFTSLPVAVSNLGIDTHSSADGIVLESEIMELVAEHGQDAPPVVLDYAKDLLARVEAHSHRKKRTATPIHTNMMATRIASSKP